jgi:hypothetical protein
MVTPATPQRLLDQSRDALAAHGGNATLAARALGIPRETLRRRAQLAASPPVKRDIRKELLIPQAPDPHEPIEQLLERKKQQYSRAKASHEFHKLIPITVMDRGPVVIAAIGDPHVDDDGCDIEQLLADMEIIAATPGMHALHLGDITNNWVGRLGRLYAHQSTTAADGIRIAEHMFKMAPPLAVVGGNHDLWNEGMSWLSFCVKQAGCDVLQSHGVRLQLVFPDGAPVRVHARHDFPGHSQFNPTHGLAREHLFGQRDHINIAGHKHVDSIAAVPSPDGFVHWMARVSGYKMHDDYAKQGHFKEMRMAPALGLLIDPQARQAAEIVKPFWDLAEAADYLAFKRRRAGAD